MNKEYQEIYFGNLCFFLKFPKNSPSENFPLYGIISGISIVQASMYLIMFVVRCLLTLIFTQRSRYVGRLHVEKHVSLFVQV